MSGAGRCHSSSASARVLTRPLNNTGEGKCCCFGKDRAQSFGGRQVLNTQLWVSALLNFQALSGPCISHPQLPLRG